MPTPEEYRELLTQWEYCYCPVCHRIRTAAELLATADGVRCSICGKYQLEQPGWVACPHHKVSAVKCPRAGRGIIKSEDGLECRDRCHFRHLP